MIARLSSLAIGALTLSPTFDPSWLFYTTSTSNASDTITAVAEDENADITIDVDSTPVVNGEAATWVEGVNLVTIKVEIVDVETAYYKVWVTKSGA